MINIHIIVFPLCSMSLAKIVIWRSDGVNSWAVSWDWMKLKSKFGSKINGRKLRRLPAKRIHWRCSWWRKDCTTIPQCRWHAKKRRCRRCKRTLKSSPPQSTDTKSFTSNILLNVCHNYPVESNGCYHHLGTMRVSLHDSHWVI